MKATDYSSHDKETNMRTKSRPLHLQTRLMRKEENEATMAKLKFQGQQERCFQAQDFPVGSRCAAFYEHGQDFCGGQTSRTGGGGWFPATVVDNDTTCLRLQFDDNTAEEFHLPTVEVQPLSAKGNQMLVPDGRVFYDTCPETIHVGDLVMARFQMNLSDEWFRGRVAAVSKDSTGKVTFCDVAYDDNDYEYSVPFGKHVINSVLRLLERGHENPLWLLGLTVALPSRAKKQIKTGVVVQALPLEPVLLEYKMKDGNSFLERTSYDQVAAAAIAHAKKQRRPKEYDFTPELLLAATTTTAGLQAQIKTTITASESLDCMQKDKSKKRANQATKGTSKKSQKTIQDHSRPTENCAMPHGGKRSYFPQSQLGTNSNRKIDICETDNSSEEEDDADFVIVRVPLTRTHPMDQAVEHAVSTALGSSSTAIGSNLFRFMSMLGSIPSERFLKSLIELITYGPKSGTVYFPDCQIMSENMRCLRTTMRNAESMHALARSAPISYAQDVFGQLEALMYMADPQDSRRDSKAALVRVHQTLHLKKCCASLLFHLLKYVKGGCERQKENNNNEDDMVYLKQFPFIHGILSHRRGAKEAFECSVKACVFIWKEFGHYLSPDSNVSYTGDRCHSLFTITSELEELVKFSGRLVSLTAWLYAKDAHESTKDLARHIATRVACEFDESWMMRDMIRYLGSAIVPGLRRAVVKFVNEE